MSGPDSQEREARGLIFFHVKRTGKATEALVAAVKKLITSLVVSTIRGLRRMNFTRVRRKGRLSSFQIPKMIETYWLLGESP